MDLVINYTDGKAQEISNVLEISNIPNTMNVIVKCGFPHWCKYALIRKDIKNMEVLV